MVNIKKIRGYFWKKLIIGLILGLCLFISFCPTASATIHRYPDGENAILYRSTQSLRDRSDLSWQLVLFKRLKSNQLDTIHLRIVGFPGRVNLPHRIPLKITTATGQTWMLEDVVDLSLPTNVGEYDILKLLTQLEKDIPLNLSITLQGDHIAELVIPPFVVKEWRKVLDLDEFSYNFSEQAREADFNKDQTQIL